MTVWFLFMSPPAFSDIAIRASSHLETQRHKARSEPATSAVRGRKRRDFRYFSMKSLFGRRQAFESVTTGGERRAALLLDTRHTAS
jgi:hypothetical protein